MFVKDYMSKDLITTNKSAKIVDVIELMKAHNIHRVPVVENKNLIGLITEGTIQEALPSKATSLSVYEINYLLNKTLVEDIMIKDIETIEQNSLLEDAIFQMRTHKVNVLPVLNSEKELVGIITNNDIFDAFLDVTGYKKPGTRVTIKATGDTEGVLAKLTDILAKNHINIIQIVVYRSEKLPLIVIQTTSHENKKVKEIIEKNGYEVISSIQTASQ